MKKVEERIEDGLRHSVLMDFLGADHVEKLKTRIVDAIVEQVVHDLSHAYEYIIDPDDIAEEIKNSTIKSATTKIQPIIEQQVTKKIMNDLGIENL